MALGLETPGLEMSGQAISANERMAAGAPSVWAIGDAVGGWMLAHEAMVEGRVAAENATAEQVTEMSDQTKEGLRETVRDKYGRVAAESSGCGPSCCGPAPLVSLALGYSASDVEGAPEGANLGLGCGNPQAIAALKPGEVVLDLGSGGGFDCFLAARQVGPGGHVIGVDMTPEMNARARANARRTNAANVEFRLGEIEHLPVADASVDVLISNCVINLSPDKPMVFKEAFRVLRPGGRIAVSDVVATAPLPTAIAASLEAYGACIGGAAQVDDLSAWLRAAGFGDIRIGISEASRTFIKDWVPGTGAERYVASATIEAVKPPAAGS